jgi:hypothetical protein
MAEGGVRNGRRGGVIEKKGEEEGGREMDKRHKIFIHTHTAQTCRSSFHPSFLRTSDFQSLIIAIITTSAALPWGTIGGRDGVRR